MLKKLISLEVNISNIYSYVKLDFRKNLKNNFDIKICCTAFLFKKQPDEEN